MNPGEIEIVDAPAQVAEAREAYARQNQARLMRLLQNPGEVRPWSNEDLGLLRASRARTVASLSALRDDNSRPTVRRVEAIAVLDLLGITPDYQQFAELGGQNDDAAKVLLLFLSRSERRDVPEPLRAFLIHCFQSHDSHVRSLAANQVGVRQVKEAFDALSSVIRAQMPQPELCLLEAAARIRPSREILNLLRDQLFSALPEWEKEDRLRAITALGAATQDIALREEVSLVCLEYLRRRPDTSSISGHVSGAVEFMAVVAPVEAAKARLRELVLSSSWRLLQKDALDELEKLDATLAAETRVHVGIESDRHRSTRKATPPESVKPTAEVAEVLVRTGVLTQSEVDRAIAKAREKSPEGADSAEELSPVAFMVFAEKLAFVNVKGDAYPARHDLLLEEFAKASGGLFNPEAPLERYHANLPDETNELHDSDGPGRWVPAGAGDYEIQFIHREKLYRFAPKDQGRWLDITAVLAAIHKALDDAGVSERFVPHAESGEIGLFMFANPAALKNASREIALPLMEGLA
jgi:hypothetical protein